MEEMICSDVLDFLTSGKREDAGSIGTLVSSEEVGMAVETMVSVMV
jgi:hypothetical protein